MANLFPVFYTQPVPGARVARLDQGIDYQGKPGGKVLAVGNAKVDAVKDDPGGFGKAIYYTLQDGPAAGQQIYVGHAQPNVKAGQTVKMGQPVATLLKSGLGNAASLSGWTEVGFARGGVPESRAANDTTAAQRFQTFLAGAPNPPLLPSQPTTPPPSTPVSPAPDQSIAPTLPPGGGPPDLTTTTPSVYDPGAGAQPSSSLPTYMDRLWQQVASQPNTSADTLLYAQNASIYAGA